MRKRIVIAVFFIIVALVAGFFLARNNPEKELIASELEEITAFLNKEENNGFVQSNYNNAYEIKLYYIFARKQYYISKEEEIKKYEELTNSEVTTGLFKATKEQIANVIVKKTGEQLGEDQVDRLKVEDFIYSASEEAYYILNSDDLFINLICKNVEKTENTYTVEYESAEKVGFQIKGVVTLTKQEGDKDWLFVSNKITETNLE